MCINDDIVKIENCDDRTARNLNKTNEISFKEFEEE